MSRVRVREPAAHTTSRDRQGGTLQPPVRNLRCQTGV